MTMSLLLEHFDDLLITPENAEQLNRAILSMAANGKLTLQNPNDEPASELLKRIYATKHDGASKEKSEKKKEAQELPHGWAFATIGDLVSQNGVFIDGDWVESKDQDPEGEVRLTQLADVGDGIYRNRSNRFMTQEKANKLSCTFLEPNDILIARMPDPLGRACLFPGDPKPCVTVVDVCVVRVGTDDIDSKWLMYAINSPDFRTSIYNLKTGTTRQRISRGNLSTLPLKVPPIAEQKRIVARVEELFVQTRALAKELEHSQIELDGLNKSALSHLLASETPEEFDQHWDFIAEHFDLLFQTPEHIAPLRQSILELAVRGKLTHREAGDESAKELLKRISEEKANIGKKETIAPIKDDEEPFDLPTAWEWVRLKQITIDLQTGPFGSNLHKSDYVANGIPVVNPVNMRDGKIVPLAEMMISEKTRERLSQYILEEGDLVLARRGEIGRCVLVTEKERGWLCGTGSLRMKLSENISKGFIVLLLKTDFARSRLTKETVGITMSNMSQTGLENLIFALPPLAEQERIVKRVEQLLSLCDAMEARLHSAEEERGRLVHAVMAGVGGSDGE